MSSEWLRVMLDEIARKKAQAEQARIEDERRRMEQDADAASRCRPAADAGEAK
jgi:hypothetical protein